jgi:hypothetical protein
MKRLLLLLILVLCFLPTIKAADAPEVRFRAAGATIGCASAATFVFLDGPFANVDNALNYPYEGTVFAAGNIYESTVSSLSGATLNNPAIGWIFETGNTGGKANAAFPLPNDTPYTLRFVLYDPSGAPAWVAIVTISKCNGGSIIRLDDFPYPTAGLPSIIDPSAPPDDRINWHYGDAHIGILYPGNEGGINLYSYADDAYHFDFVTEAMLEEYTDHLPSSPVLLAQQGLISAYLLPDGRIQFNLGSDAEGKWYEVILDSLSDRDIEGIAHDPNQ